MIKKIECYVAVCDVCEKFVDDDADTITHYDFRAEAEAWALERTDNGGSGCQMIDGKLCCQKCWYYDDNDKIVVRGGK